MLRWILVLAIFAEPAMATVLYRAPKTSRLDYKAALKADTEGVSPADHHLRTHPLASAREALIAATTAAQEAFVSGSKDSARAEFEKVVAMMTSDDWSASDRQIFLHAYFRLAQLESNELKQRQWLAHALLAGEDLKPDADLFPPPLLRTWSQIRAELPRRKVSVEGDWSLVLLNGRPCRIAECTLPQVEAPVRVTLLSDVWVTWSSVLEASRTEKLSPSKVAWVEGSCAQPEYHKSAASERRLVCDPKGPLNLKPVAAAPSIPKPVDDKKFYQNKWLWAGVGAVVVGIIIASAQKSKDDKEPSTTYGH